MTNREAMGKRAPDALDAQCVPTTSAEHPDPCGKPATIHLLLLVDGVYSTSQACDEHAHVAVQALDPEDAHPFEETCVGTGLLQPDWRPSSPGGTLGHCVPQSDAVVRAQAAMEAQLAEILGGE